MSTLAPLHQALVDAGFPEGIVQADKSLYSLETFVRYSPCGTQIKLDGMFTAQQLRALAAWMEAAHLLVLLQERDNLRGKLPVVQDHAADLSEAEYIIGEVTKALAK